MYRKHTDVVFNDMAIKSKYIVLLTIISMITEYLKQAKKQKKKKRKKDNF